MAGSSQDLLSDDEGDQNGQTSLVIDTGNVVIVTCAADEGTNATYGAQCTFVGTAFSH